MKSSYQNDQFNLIHVNEKLGSECQSKGPKSRRKLLRQIVVFFFAFLISVGLNDLRAQSSFPVQYIGIEHGLSNNAVTSIYQDHYGFMWFGTYDGLNRYDGYNFRVFRNRPKDSLTLINNRIVAIEGDQDNRIWVGTKKGMSLFDYKTSTFSDVLYLPLQQTQTKKIDAAVNDIETDDKGNVFIATGGEGLMICKRGAQMPVQLPLRKSSGVTTHYFVQSVKADNSGKFWLFIQGEGIYTYDYQTNEIRLVNKTLRTGASIMPDNRGNLWVASELGLFKYNIPSDSVTRYTTNTGGLTNDIVVSLLLDKEQNLWIATDGGGVNILNLVTQKMSYLPQGQNKSALTSGAIYALYEDSDSRKWIGTLRGGINLIDRQRNKFKTVSHDPLNKNSLINNFILSFCEDEKSNLWIGTDGEGLSFWDRRQRSFTNFVHNATDPNSLSNNNVARIIKDYNNEIWIATYGGGICRYKSSDRSFKRYPCFNSSYNYEDRNVWSLYEDAKHTLWAGTCAGGLYRLDRNKDRFELFDVHVSDVITLAEDKAGNLWAGTFNDLVKVDKINKQHRFYKSKYSIRAIWEDKNDNLWVGSEGGGLLNFNRKKEVFTTYTEDDGLPNNSVLNILEDNQGNLWLSTYNGISKFNPQDKKFKNFHQSDGLQSNQFNYNAALRLASGEFIFGGIKGYNVFYPDSIQSSGNHPDLILTGIRINNTSIENDPGYTGTKSVYSVEELTLPYDKAVLSVDFAVLEYSGPDKISYAYFLEGWDRDWTFSGKVRTANYSRLREGNYTLRIKSTNSDGVWNTKERRIRISVLPPWYRSWWAYGAYTCLLAFCLFFYAHYQSKQAKLKYEIKIVNLKAEKEKELNEKKLAFFTNISHEFRTPLTLIINPVKELLYSDKPVDKNDFSIVYRNARRLLSLVDQLLLFRKADSDEDNLKLVKLNFSRLCSEVFLCFTHQARSKKIQYELICDNENIEIYGDREKIEIVLFNLISNALKYTPDEGKILLSVKNSDSNIEITITDNGCGIPEGVGLRLFDRFYQVFTKEKNSKRGFGIGLYLSKKFIDSHKGEISYESRVGAGTTFKILLLKGKEHFGSSYIYEDVEESSVFLEELVADSTSEVPELQVERENGETFKELVSEKKTLLVVDDNDQIREYVKRLFINSFHVEEADNAEDAFKLVQENLPDIIISDILMKGKSGIEFCSQVKEDPALNHIPFILLTGSSSPEIKLKGIEEGADDYITKPFDKELLIARVTSILKSRTNLQKYFYNEVTLQSNDQKISSEYKEFLTKCITIIENHLDDSNFNISVLATEIGMSHSNLYKKVKSISGRSVNEFMRFIRLRKAAELLINTDYNVNETALRVGFNDIKYFREQFNKLFEMNPSQYIRKYRKTFHKNYKLSQKVSKSRNE